MSLANLTYAPPLLEKLPVTASAEFALTLKFPLLPLMKCLPMLILEVLVEENAAEPLERKSCPIASVALPEMLIDPLERRLKSLEIATLAVLPMVMIAPFETKFFDENVPFIFNKCPEAMVTLLVTVILEVASTVI